MQATTTTATTLTQPATFNKPYTIVMDRMVATLHQLSLPLPHSRFRRRLLFPSLSPAASKGRRTRPARIWGLPVQVQALGLAQQLDALSRIGPTCLLPLLVLKVRIRIPSRLVSLLQPLLPDTPLASVPTTNTTTTSTAIAPTAVPTTAATASMVSTATQPAATGIHCSHLPPKGAGQL
mmetsp:Transcript_12103/g.26679  ORF Transcript_12103/g.26679 Transcript_12103/m.26679 type:complete len:179 (-) Transcript_12103:1947-2483(-)